MDVICYTGIGARKSGNHTKKQYLDVMNKNFKRDCATHIKSLKCKSCKKLKTLYRGILKTHLKTLEKNKKNKKNKTYKMTKKTRRKLRNATNNCIKCSNKNLKQCDVDNYILYTGAVKGACGKI